jgi:hypothetical protein
MAAIMKCQNLELAELSLHATLGFMAGSSDTVSQTTWQFRTRSYHIISTGMYKLTADLQYRWTVPSLKLLTLRTQCSPYVQLSLT